MLRVKTLNFSTLVDSQFPNCFLALIILNLNLILACNIYINSLIYTNFLLELFFEKEKAKPIFKFVIFKYIIIQTHTGFPLPWNAHCY